MIDADELTGVGFELPVVAEPAFGFNGQHGRLVLEIHDDTGEQARFLRVVQRDARAGEQIVLVKRNNRLRVKTTK